MDADTNATPAAGAVTETPEDSGSFTIVTYKKTHKRKRGKDDADMDTEGHVASKRPQLPPISSDKLKVYSCSYTLCFSVI